MSSSLKHPTSRRRLQHAVLRSTSTHVNAPRTRSVRRGEPTLAAPCSALIAGRRSCCRCLVDQDGTRRRLLTVWAEITCSGKSHYAKAPGVARSLLVSMALTNISSHAKDISNNGMCRLVPQDAYLTNSMREETSITESLNGHRLLFYRIRASPDKKILKTHCQNPISSYTW